MAGNGNKDGEPATEAWPHCPVCDAKGHCRFQGVMRTLIAKAEVLQGLSRDNDAEELIAAAFLLCDEAQR